MSTFSNKTFGVVNYAKFRPSYPQRLYKHILDYHKVHASEPINLIVDVGCGTGQATKGLAKFGAHTIGMDPSEAMVVQANSEVQNQNNIEFTVGSDSDIETKLKPHSVDILSSAESSHYFTWPQFWDGAAAVLKPGGTVAIFSYWTFAFPNYPEVAKIIDNYAFADDQCGPYWDDGRAYLNNEYIDFVNSVPKDKFTNLEYKVNHFDQFRPDHPFELVKDDIPVGEVISMLKTWSPYFNYKKHNPNAPDIADAVMDKINKATGLKPEDTVTMKWNTVYILATRKPLTQ